MRTASLVTFASLCLSLLAGCAGAEDIGLRLPEGSGNVPSAVHVTVATDLPRVVSPTALPLDETEVVETPAPTTNVPAPSASVSPDATATSGPVSDEQYTFDPSISQESLAPLGSFRQKAVLDFTADGSGIRSKVTYEGEVTAAPSALHSLVRVEGQGAPQLPTNQVEVTWIGDQAWVKVGFKPWASVPTTAVRSVYRGEVVGAADLLPFIHEARRVLPDETVNGIRSRHYVYDVENLHPDVGMVSAQGDVWVARDGGYVVRLTLEGKGTYYNTYDANGTLRLVYDLYDVDVPLTITPPR